MSGVGSITPWHRIPGWRMPPGTGTHIAFRFESKQRPFKRRQSDCLVTLSFSLPSIECPSHGGDSGWPNCEQHWRSDCELGLSLGAAFTAPKMFLGNSHRGSFDFYCRHKVLF